VAAVAFVLALGGVVPRAHAGASATLPRRAVLDGAIAAYQRVQRAGLLHTPLLTVIDYSLPSTERRLWVLDPARLRVFFHEFVAHGRGSATEETPEIASTFGNEPESRRSSLGTYLTGASYVGMHGYSLELLGLDAGVNDRAYERRIVMHPADYVSAAYRAEKEGRVGRSWGCPALDPAVATPIIDRIQAGSVLYVAGPEPVPAAPLVQTASARSFVERMTSAQRRPSSVRHAAAGKRTVRVAAKRTAGAGGKRTVRAGGKRGAPVMRKPQRRRSLVKLARTETSQLDVRRGRSRRR
jgi:hypothetical protein